MYFVSFLLSFIFDRILSKIKLPTENKKYIFKPENKNIVKVEIDRFPIGQEEGLGHVIPVSYTHLTLPTTTIV